MSSIYITYLEPEMEVKEFSLPIQQLELLKNDVILITTDKVLSSRHKEHIAYDFKWAGIKNKVMFLEAGMGFNVIQL